MPAGAVKRLALVLATLVAALGAWPAVSLSVQLPEGRAYERVSPADKNNGDVGGPALQGGFATALGQSATDGESIGYASLASFADAQSADLFTHYISRRTSSGWTTNAISPPPAEPPRFLQLPAFRVFAADLSAAVLEWKQPLLVPDAPPEHTNLYLRSAAGAYLLLTKTPPLNLPASSYLVRFAGATPDLSHIVFEANDALLPEAPAEAWSVYEWSAAQGLQLVSFLPDETAAPEAFAGSAAEGDYSQVISADGSRVFWTADEQLYAREGGTRSVKLNASRRAVSLGDGSATLLGISGDGSKAYFFNTVSLTDDAGGIGGLYEYDLGEESLRRLAPDSDGEQETNAVLGAAADGSSVYFVSSAALATGAEDGQPNLYLDRDGELDLIATLSSEDMLTWNSNLELRGSRVTADGDRLAFLSKASLTGYDNTDAKTGEPDNQLFVYDADQDQLTCVSCNPSGERPIGGASLPAGTPSSYQQRIFSADGSRVFFNSADALAPGDSNHRQDVYVFADGKPQLISSGTSSDISALVDVGGGGRDVFFTTRARLVGADRDTGADLYDARVGGGFPEPVESLPCAGEGCRAPLGAAPQAAPFPATALPWPEAEPPLKPRHRKRCRGQRGKAGAKAKAAKRKRCGKARR